MNKVIRLLVLNDLFFWTALGFLGPIFAIYINDDVSGSSLGLTGLAVAAYWLVKSAVALLVSRYTDRQPGNRVKLRTLLSGIIIATFAPLAFLWAGDIIDIIIIQVIFGIGAGLAFPGWMTIFTRSVKKGHEGFLWSLDTAGINLGNGIATAISGFIAQAFGFNILFVLVFVFNVVSLMMILFLFRYQSDILNMHDKYTKLVSRI